MWRPVASAASSTSSPQLAPTAGFDGRTITLAALTTTTHPLWGQIGKSINAGIEAHIAAINRRGGIAGRYPIRLVSADTNYDATLTVNGYTSLAPKAVGFVTVLGTPNVDALLPLLERDQVVASPASQEAGWSRSSVLMPVMNTYQVQAISGLAYYYDQPTSAGSVACAASIGTSFGEAGNEGFRYAQQRLGFTAGPIVTLSPTDPAPIAALAQLRQAQCRAVLVTAAPQQAAALVVAGAQSGFTPRWILLGASFSERAVTATTGIAFEQNVWVVADGSNWDDPSLPGLAQLKRELIDSNNRYWVENPDTGLAYGWVQARSWEQLLERAVAAGDLSRAGVVSALAQLAAPDIGGLGATIDYSRLPRLSAPRASVFAVDNSQRNAIRPLRVGYESPAAVGYRK